jgi:predicted amidohydrolase YtcJ
MKLTLYCLCLLSIAVISCKPHQLPADLLVYGGTIYTVEDTQPQVEAVAVRDGRIVFAGAMKDAEAWTGEKTERLDLQGKTMTPGFIEGHGHLMGVGYNALELDLMDVTSYEEMVERVRAAVAKAKPGAWILGRGWHQDKWTSKPKKMVKGFQTHELLSAVSPNNPVFLRHASSHAGFANAKAMELAGVNLLSVEKLQHDYTPEGGEIIRDELGNPTGIFNEVAMGIIAKRIPPRTVETNAQALQLAMEACWKYGITGFHDAGASREEIALYHQFRDEGKLNLRLYVMVTGRDRPLVHEWLRRGPEIDSTGTLTVRAIKLNCDGALGSRGAWLLEPYTDRPDFYGLATLPMDTVLATARQGLTRGFQVCAHAIGDRANREILDRYAQAFREQPAKAKDARFRIEHAQHLNPSDIPRFAGLGVIPAMQAIHMSSDRPWAIERLGAKRIREGAYMWQSLLRSGVRIVNGTDAPIEPVNPIPCFYAAITRKTLLGQPEGGYEPEERMTRAQALRSYTTDVAYGAFEEKIKGTIAVGKLADFTVFTHDIMTVPEDEVLKTDVALTMVGGKVVYKK